MTSYLENESSDKKILSFQYQIIHREKRFKNQLEANDHRSREIREKSPVALPVVNKNIVHFEVGPLASFVCIKLNKGILQRGLSPLITNNFAPEKLIILVENEIQKRAWNDSIIGIQKFPIRALK